MSGWILDPGAGGATYDPAATGRPTGNSQAVNQQSPPAAPKPNNPDGSYRPDVGFDINGGIRVAMRAERGITPKGFLTVPFRFQCPPLGDYTRDSQYPWPTFNTLSEGDRSRPQGAALAQWPISTMFLWDYESFVIWTGTSQRNPSAVNGVFEPQRFLRELRHIGESNVVFRLHIDEPVIWGSTALVDSLASIIDISTVQRAGEIGTEYPTVTFQEFREMDTQGKRRSNPSSLPHAYKVRATDTLYDIARTQLGSPSQWRRIAAVNGISGIDPGSARELQAWLGWHRKTTLQIPKVARHEASPQNTAAR